MSRPHPSVEETSQNPNPARKTCSRGHRRVACRMDIKRKSFSIGQVLVNDVFGKTVEQPWSNF